MGQSVSLNSEYNVITSKDAINYVDSECVTLFKYLIIII